VNVRAVRVNVVVAKVMQPGFRAAG
jgi:hypothetical protein